MAEKKKKNNTVEIVNRKARFEYHFNAEFEAGLMLTGTEIKSLRTGNANLKDAFCFFKKGELFVKNMFIAEYKFGSYHNHETRRVRKLLLRKPELRKLNRKATEKGFSIVPYRIYFTERGIAKLEIILGQGKKSFDKRATIKERESKRDLNRLNKIRL